LELSYEELDGFIQQIFLGRKLTYVEKRAGEKVPLLLSYPSPADHLVAGHVYTQALEEAREMGLPSVEEMSLVIRERGIYTDADDAEIERLRAKLVGQRAVLAKTTRVPARKDRLKKIISDLEQQVREIEYKRESGLSLTGERKAAEQKFLYLTWRGTLNLFTGERLWNTWEDFQQEPDFLFRKKVFLDFIIFFHGLRPEVLRYIARSNLWRTRYITALKTSDPLFGRAIRDYTVDQIMVLYWSHFYQSIYEMLPDDRPADTIIEDDEALDAYMTDWNADRNREAIASRAKKGKRYGQSTAWDHNETIVLRSNPMHEDIEYSATMAGHPRHEGAATVDAAPIGKGKAKRG